MNPKPKAEYDRARVIFVRCKDAELHRRLRMVAAYEDRTMESVALDAIREYVDTALNMASSNSSGERS